MDFVALAAELTGGHPVTGAYNADAQTAADQINLPNVTRTRAFMTGSQMWANTSPTEFAALTNVKKGEWLSFCAIDEHVPINNGLAHQFINYIFPASSDTLSNLAAVRTEAVSQATALGLGNVEDWHIEQARAL